MSRLPGASRGGIEPHRAVARQASRSKPSPQSNPHHPGLIRADPSAGIGRAARHRRSAAGLVAGIIALGLVGLCLRTLPTLLTDSSLVAQFTGPLTGIPVPSPSAAAPAAPSPTTTVEPATPARTSLTSVKLQAKRKAKSNQQAEVPESGPGTYQAAERTVRSTSTYGTLIRYDVRIEDGLSVDPDKAAVLIQRVLDDRRSWRGTRRWRFELVPVGESASLHAYIVTPKTTDRLCAPYLTRGEVSCQNGTRVVLNAKRWLLGVDSYRSDLTNYRRYLVNHEFGHALGKHHVDCPGPGRPAPVMMQQTKGLGACRKNPWPQVSED
ncbi:MAG TPA: DUF3152 domain-containing protein [Propionibacteriaceae bacterium]|nr:DUF3152 domain-containing protein [Propionibacteriaceae bacterium]